MNYYASLDVPNFEQAYAYARELEDVMASSKQAQMEIAQLYVSWSTSLKMKIELDPIKEMLRQQKYKELASSAVKLLERVPMNTHEWHHLMARSNYNRWDNDVALSHIDKAISELPKASYLLNPYWKLRAEIVKKQAMFEHTRN